MSQMRVIATDAVAWSVCLSVLVTTVNPAKQVSESRFIWRGGRGSDSLGPINHALYGGQDIATRRETCMSIRHILDNVRVPSVRSPDVTKQTNNT